MAESRPGNVHTSHNRIVPRSRGVLCEPRHQKGVLKGDRPPVVLHNVHLWKNRPAHLRARRTP